MKKSEEVSVGPLNSSWGQVQREWMMLMTRPWVEACKERGPVHTRRVTTWKRRGRWAATRWDVGEMWVGVGAMWVGCG